MSLQRRRGQKATVYPEVRIKNARDETVIVPDMENGIEVRAAFIPQRSTKAEVPGQVGIDVTRMILRHDLPNVGLFSQVRWRGRLWDVASPPSYHHGTPLVRHYSMDIRARPHGER